MIGMAELVIGIVGMRTGFIILVQKSGVAVGQALGIRPRFLLRLVDDLDLHPVGPGSHDLPPDRDLKLEDLFEVALFGQHGGQVDLVVRGSSDG